MKRQRGRSNSVSTNRPETAHLLLMPLPRSGAPSPGHALQVGAVEVRVVVGGNGFDCWANVQIVTENDNKIKSKERNIIWLRIRHYLLFYTGLASH